MTFGPLMVPLLMAMPITLNVNGQDRKVTVEPRTSLLEVLRDQLGLTGCKDLQDVSVDGADTVMVDGKATYAGATLALSATAKQIHTVESLRNGNELDEVVSCFVTMSPESASLERIEKNEG